ncbi:MAG: hypothetical protein CME70_23980 [Halobacteriovorax sp.]|nr:hypothetical protein [Halobacteriovorax sp.]
MIGFKSIVLILIFICSGCAQHIKVSPRRCLAPKAAWSLRTDEDKFRYRHHIRSNNEYTYIRKIFDKKGMDCAYLDHINLTHKYTWKDILWNLVPFAGRSTLIVGGSSSTLAPIK